MKNYKKGDLVICTNPSSIGVPENWNHQIIYIISSTEYFPQEYLYLGYRINGPSQTTYNFTGKQIDHFATLCLPENQDDK